MTAPPSADDDSRRQWRRLFGIALIELFEDAPWRVELEQEPAVRSQLLDVAIIEAIEENAEHRLPPDLPDGLDGLRAHNLLTYKSHHEALNLYQREVPDRAYTYEEFLREAEEMEREFEESAIERDPEALLKLIPEDVLKRFEVEKRLRGLDPAFVEAWLAKQRGDH